MIAERLHEVDGFRPDLVSFALGHLSLILWDLCFPHVLGEYVFDLDRLKSDFFHLFINGYCQFSLLSVYTEEFWRPLSVLMDIPGVFSGSV